MVSEVPFQVPYPKQSTGRSLDRTNECRVLSGTFSLEVDNGASRQCEFSSARDHRSGDKYMRGELKQDSLEVFRRITGQEKLVFSNIGKSFGKSVELPIRLARPS